MFSVENLSIKENTIAGIKVYPNPTTGILNVKSDVTIKSLELYNSLGQLVLSKTDVDFINISSVSEGVYFLKAMDLNGNSQNVSIVKE